MSNTLPNITVLTTEWVDVYSLTGIPVGTSLVITNNSESTLLVQEQATQPLADNTDGILFGNVFNTNQATVTNNPTTVWLKATKSTCSVNIQAI